MEEEKIKKAENETKEFKPQGKFESFSVDLTQLERKISTGKTIPPHIHKEIWEVIIDFWDIFSWTQGDLGTISRDNVKYRLGIQEKMLTQWYRRREYLLDKGKG